jgi:hypothetical protein
MVDEDALPGKIRDNRLEPSLRGSISRHPNHGASRPAGPFRFPEMSRALKGPPGVKQ